MYLHNHNTLVPIVFDNMILKMGRRKLYSKDVIEAISSWLNLKNNSSGKICQGTQIGLSRYFRVF